VSEGPEREVVIMMSDMVQYSRQTSRMRPEEIRDFLLAYHGTIHQLLVRDEFLPIDVEPSAGDGCLVIFDRRSHETDNIGCCTRAIKAARRIMVAIADGFLAPTRMGILLGLIIEARLGQRLVKFGASFAVANRLEELCGHFGTYMLMDREVARYQQCFRASMVNIGKISLSSMSHPMNIYSIYEPGLQYCPKDADPSRLGEFIRLKNEAMEYFSGNLLLGLEPDFPRVREELILAQNLYLDICGQADIGTERILEYIRETPVPPPDFDQQGMALLEKKRDLIGERLFHLSKELLRAMNQEFYHYLVEDTGWERHFKLEWRKKGDLIIQVGSIPDGIYYLDNGTVETYSGDGQLLSSMEAGEIFGEMAYFGKEKKRTATVVAVTDVVLRKISTEDFARLPGIIRIFERIADARRERFTLETAEKKKIETN
jgi:CRP-like cAMP-binding protein/class 3 adenylate cyclase